MSLLIGQCLRNDSSSLTSSRFSDISPIPVRNPSDSIDLEDEPDSLVRIRRYELREARARGSPEPIRLYRRQRYDKYGRELSDSSFESSEPEASELEYAPRERRHLDAKHRVEPVAWWRTIQESLSALADEMRLESSSMSIQEFGQILEKKAKLIEKTLDDYSYLGHRKTAAKEMPRHRTIYRRRTPISG